MGWGEIGRKQMRLDLMKTLYRHYEILSNKGVEGQSFLEKETSELVKIELRISVCVVIQFSMKWFLIIMRNL